MKRLADSDSEEEGEGSKPKAKKPALAPGQTPTDLLTVSQCSEATEKQGAGEYLRFK